LQVHFFAGHGAVETETPLSGGQQLLIAMANNPYFEIEQVEKYLDYLSKNTADLGKTAESNFFPMLQRVFFFRACEVRRKVEFEGRSFPFDCIDVLNCRGRILVHFSLPKQPPPRCGASFSTRRFDPLGNLVPDAVRLRRTPDLRQFARSRSDGISGCSSLRTSSYLTILNPEMMQRRP
jgi:hypothetical protein